jgi:hypothetical protein
MHVQSTRVASYFVLHKDDESGFMYIYFIYHKFETFDIINWLKMK